MRVDKDFSHLVGNKNYQSLDFNKENIVDKDNINKKEEIADLFKNSLLEKKSDALNTLNLSQSIEVIDTDKRNSYDGSLPTQRLSESIGTSQLLPTQRLSESIGTRQLLPTQRLSESIGTRQLLPTQRLSESIGTSQLLPTQRLSESIGTSQLLPTQRLSESISTSQLLPTQRLSESISTSQLLPTQRLSESISTSRLLPTQRLSESIENMELDARESHNEFLSTLFPATPSLSFDNVEVRKTSRNLPSPSEFELLALVETKLPEFKIRKRFTTSSTSVEKQEDQLNSKGMKRLHSDTGALPDDDYSKRRRYLNHLELLLTRDRQLADTLTGAIELSHIDFRDYITDYVEDLSQGYYGKPYSSLSYEKMKNVLKKFLKEHMPYYLNLIQMHGEFVQLLDEEGNQLLIKLQDLLSSKQNLIDYFEWTDL